VGPREDEALPGVEKLVVDELKRGRTLRSDGVTRGVEKLESPLVKLDSLVV
jgi:hypothetical protein